MSARDSGIVWVHVADEADWAFLALSTHVLSPGTWTELVPEATWPRARDILGDLWRERAGREKAPPELMVMWTPAPPHVAMLVLAMKPGALLAAINGGLMEGAGNEWQWAGNRTAEARA